MAILFFHAEGAILEVDYNPEDCTTVAKEVSSQDAQGNEAIEAESGILGDCLLEEGDPEDRIDAMWVALFGSNTTSAFAT